MARSVVSLKQQYEDAHIVHSTITMFAPVDDSLRKVFGNVTKPEEIIGLESIFQQIYGKHVIVGAFSQKQLLEQFNSSGPWMSWDVMTRQSLRPISLQAQEFKGLLTLFGGNLSVTVVEGDINACNSLVHITEGLFIDI
eukprot:TRINITY_DN2826_c1_g1_i1.p1 TRINITY_DN2826_c1_g1~~TRINITY_DN2826_c1_g1_i1.p1  ORF type:complete len:139 (+),score=12.25 TRINITY_DN2826_c1_g1_i1:81-497(+)